MTQIQHTRVYGWRMEARNITVNNANTAGDGDVTVNNCQIAFDSTSGSEALAIIDATITNTPIFVRVPEPNSGSLTGSLVLNNIKLNNVPTGVVSSGQTVLNGGTTTINSWAQGNVFSGTNAKPRFLQDNIGDISKANVLLDSSGKVFGRGRPAYADYAVSQFVSVKSQGAHGDGHTDDTALLQKIFDQASFGFSSDRGHLILISSTLTIPAGTQIVGEAWSNIMGSGQTFQNQNIPQAVIRVGAPGSTGTVEISGIVFTTRAPANGAIVVEWNVHDPAGQQGAAGAWDTIIRLGGAAGTNIQEEQCSNAIDNTGDNCFAAFMGLHLTSGSSAYLEGLWVWLGDHDLDGSESIELMAFSGRGILSESQGPVWMVGTAAEHNVLYQYNLAGAANHYMGLIQTETAYYQPNPVPPSPFISNSNYLDPVFSGEGAGWALYVQNSSDILVFGGGLYSFFSAGIQIIEHCRQADQQLVNIDSSSSVGIYSFSTIGVIFQLSVDHKGVIPQSANPTGFAQVFTGWTQH
ncbi:hypothetical protein EWM64_g3548 [Hericium alpestre]|uniref:Pectate lyase superfamily protein domain-containing protein n=1 Tax=Hericium alpestre TaxID=135208 RepID=A0A4Z0A1Z4_9AGAM|nr:hypothetical protein EWM64_g3548 [Hericium alpestre]